MSNTKRILAINDIGSMAALKQDPRVLNGDGDSKIRNTPEVFTIINTQMKKLFPEIEISFEEYNAALTEKGNSLSGAIKMLLDQRKIAGVNVEKDIWVPANIRITKLLDKGQQFVALAPKAAIYEPNLAAEVFGGLENVIFLRVRGNLDKDVSDLIKPDNIDGKPFFIRNNSAHANKFADILKEAGMEAPQEKEARIEFLAEKFNAGGDLVDKKFIPYLRGQFEIRFNEAEATAAKLAEQGVDVRTLDIAEVIDGLDNIDALLITK